MADMGEMQMPLPDNTLPMMTGQGPYGSIEMGGMFTTVKVRKGLARNDYKDPGWYGHPAGTQAYEWAGDARAAGPVSQPGTTSGRNNEVILSIRKGNGHGSH
jgi:hypothetical protein